MANEKHLKILKEGVEVWDVWRGDRPGETIVLRNADLVVADPSVVILGPPLNATEVNS